MIFRKVVVIRVRGDTNGGGIEVVQCFIALTAHKSGS